MKIWVSIFLLFVSIFIVSATEAVMTNFHALYPNVDARTFGYSESEPLYLFYSYNPVQTPAISHQIGRTDYGPISGQLVLGADVVDLVGVLSVLDDYYDEKRDQLIDHLFFISHRNGSYPESITGWFGDYRVESIGLYFRDQTEPLDMLSSTALPDSASFSLLADYVYLSVNTYSPKYDEYETLPSWSNNPEPFIFTSEQVPLPSTILLLGTGLLGLAGIRTRFNELPRRKQRGITEGLDRFTVASDGVLDPLLRNKKTHRNVSK